MNVDQEKILVFLFVILVPLTEQSFNETSAHLMKDLTKHLHIKDFTKMLSPTSGHGKFNTSFLYENIRRNNYYTTPDLSDSSFQSLLDEYRALVHKSDSTPMSQVFQKEYFEQYQQNFHQYYGLPEKYNTRNIDHIFKRWKTALTAKIYYTTKRVFAHKGLYNIAREGEAAPAEGIEEKGGEAPLTEGLGVVAPLAEEVGGPAPSAEGEGEQKETEGGGELKSGEELVLGNAGPPGLANRPTMRFTTQSTNSRRRFKRTTPYRISMIIDCDYNAYYCLKGFTTGHVCGRSLFITFYTFKNYCMLDFVNCMERSEAWQPAYMGKCFEMQPLSEYKSYHYSYDTWFRQYYVADDI